MRRSTKNLTMAALFLALGLLLPSITGHIQQIGNMLLPMHLPVMLCGLVCGPVWGTAVGAVTPLLRSFLFGMPPFYPTAFAMAFELCTYGLVIGFLYQRSRWKCIRAVFRSLVIAMIAGRLVWGVVRVIQTGVAGSAFTWQMFLAGAVLNAVPGIVLQLILIPTLMVALGRAKLIPELEQKPDGVNEG